MIHFNATLCHDFFQIRIRNPITNIEKYSVKNNIFWKMGAFKTDYRFIQSLKIANYPSI